jgi:SAM-dependent methyltransferase
MTAPLDAAGFETLEIMAEAPRYNAWQYRRIAPFLGRRICEVGSGLGNMSRYLVEHESELTVLTDMDPVYLRTLREKFSARSDVFVEPLRLPQDEGNRPLDRYQVDTIVALNVLEHIPDDVGALASLRSSVAPQARAIILVPALPGLYGSLDEDLGHVRRYTRASLSACLISAGLRVERMFYFNLVGAFGWWMNARVWNAKRISTRQLRLFDSLVPLLSAEDRFPLPWGQSIIAVSRFS